MSTSTPDLEKKFYTIAVTGGSGGQAISDDYGSAIARELLHIVVKAPNTTDTFIVYIREIIDDIEVYRREDEVVGEINEIFTTALPLCGTHEIYITNASSDGNYKVRFVYR